MDAGVGPAPQSCMVTRMLLNIDELAGLVSSEEYKGFISLGLKDFADAAMRAGDGDFKPDVTWLFSYFGRFWRNSTIQRELRICVDLLFKEVLKRDTEIGIDIEYVRQICESQNFHWMRFDVPRVKALFRKADITMRDPKMRALLSKHCSFSEEKKNLTLDELVVSLKFLSKQTVDDLNLSKLYYLYVDIQARRHLEQNKDQIREYFLNAGKSGALGPLPDHLT